MNTATTTSETARRRTAKIDVKIEINFNSCICSRRQSTEG
jgi:hypothetical protein